MIRVLLFAALRDAAGRDCIELPAQPQDTARSLWDRLRSDCPALNSFTARTRVAVNGKYASWEAEVQPGDEVVFFPPVSGGVR
ncbi:MAG: molybdopterin converting factor subunit 1 [Acidobacteriota bacterium]